MKGNKVSTNKPNLPEAESRAIAAGVKAAIDGGARLYITVPHTSRSNMSYTVRARLIGGDTNADIWLNYWLAAATGATLDAQDDIRQNGCGTDRAFLVAYAIAHVLRGYGLAEARFEYEIKRSWF